MSIVPLSKKEHLNFSFKEFENFQEFKKRNLIPLCFAEVIQVVTDFTIVFTKVKDSFTICILTGFTTDNNLYIDDNGKWLAKYVPAIATPIPACTKKKYRALKQIIFDHSISTVIIAL